MGSVEEVAVHSEVQTTWATTQLREQLESEIAVAMSSAAESLAMRMHEAKKWIRRDVEAELQKLQADTYQEAENTRIAVDNLAAKLDQLIT